MKITICGVWDYSTSSLGAQALSEGIIRKVKHTYPKAKVTIIPQQVLLRGISVICRVFRKPSVFAIPLFEVLYFFYKHNLTDRMKAVREADMVLINGDGVVADMFCADTLVLAMDLRTAMEAGVTCCSLNQSVNVEEDTLAQYCVKDYFMPNPLSVREPDSLNLIKRRFPEKRPHLSLDAAFLVDELARDEKERYSVMVEALRSRYGFNDYILCGIRGNRPSSHIIDPESWARVLRKIQDVFPGHTIVLASTCPEHDMPLAQKLLKLVPGSVMPTELADHRHYNYRFFMQFLKEAAMTIADRYHQNVLAALVGTPFIPVEGNTSKTTGTVKILEYPVPVHALPSPSTVPDYDITIKKMYTEQRALRQYLIDVVPGRISLHDSYTEFLQSLGED